MFELGRLFFFVSGIERVVGGAGTDVGGCVRAGDASL